MRRVAVVQARMASSRLPGKVLMDLGGKPMLAQQIRRLKASTCVDEIVIATTTSAADQPITALAAAEDVRWSTGSESDVLDRYRAAASEANADVVIRVTSDCPLIDPEQTNRVVTGLTDSSEPHDYASNIIRRTFPRGLEVEALWRDTLERLHRLARSRPAREHVTWFLLRERPDLFVIRSIEDEADNSDLRWTVDTEDDLRAMRAIYDGMQLSERVAPYSDVLAFVRRNPEIAEMNRHVQQKSI